MKPTFLNSTSLIEYSADSYLKITFNAVEEIQLTDPNTISWLNTFGNTFLSEIRSVITNNKLDDFFIKLTTETEHPNKVLAMGDTLFVSLKVLKTETTGFQFEQMVFIVSPWFLWSIQEREGDYFDFIRERLETNKGIVRTKRADYLLFLIIDAIIDNYADAYRAYFDSNADDFDVKTLRSTPEFAQLIEQRKQDLFKFKKAAVNLRDAISKLEKQKIPNIKPKYFSELKEQANYLIDDTDFELQQLESSINLIFNLQGHKLNEIMKTLTIFSVIFIPLTFLAGIYGMNFKYIPELETQNGYFVLLGVMAIVAIGSVVYFKTKKWY